MEKGEYKTGQLLGVKEQRGRLVREYVAGFFGEEPIIKQRLLTPQEARRYREDLARGKQEGKSESEAAKEAGTSTPGAPPQRRLVRKLKTGEPGKKLVRKKRPVEAPGEEVAEEQSEKRPMRMPREAGAGEVGQVAAQMLYVPEGASSNQEFINNLINSEPDKPNFNPANTQAALERINRIGCPDMKIYRVGATEEGKEAEYYSQKEYIAREILGLPLWKPKPDKTEEPETKADVDQKPSIPQSTTPADQEDKAETEESTDKESATETQEDTQSETETPVVEDKADVEAEPAEQEA